MNVEKVLATEIVGSEQSKMGLVEAIETKTKFLGCLEGETLNIHDFVRVLQLRESDSECKHGQNHNDDPADAWGLHIPFYNTSISLRRPHIQLFKVKTSDSFHSLGN